MFINSLNTELHILVSNVWSVIAIEPNARCRCHHR